jgi:hypothetical protein
VIWQKAQGNPPPPNGDSRKLVWIVDKDGMAWIGIRFWRGDMGEWYVNDREESGTVTHWMDLPDPPPAESLPLGLGHEFKPQDFSPDMCGFWQGDRGYCGRPESEH